jgi:hypothetical protein
MKRSLGQNFVVVAIFGTFERYVTHLRRTFVENVKKVKNQPTLVPQQELHRHRARGDHFIAAPHP